MALRKFMEVINDSMRRGGKLQPHKIRLQVQMNSSTEFLFCMDATCIWLAVLFF